jgi:hypothetical protein
MIPLVMLSAVLASAPVPYWSVPEHRELHRVGRPTGPPGPARLDLGLERPTAEDHPP